MKEALGLSDLSQINRLETLWEFDDLLTTPLHGFKNFHDYCEKASCRQYLTGIQVPALLVHALDDPFMVPEVVPQTSEFRIWFRQLSFLWEAMWALCQASFQGTGGLGSPKLSPAFSKQIFDDGFWFAVQRGFSDYLPFEEFINVSGKGKFQRH